MIPWSISIGLDHTCMGSCCLLSISGWELHLGLEFCISQIISPKGQSARAMIPVATIPVSSRFREISLKTCL